MKKEDIPLIKQLIESLEENFSNLENSYKKKDFETFNEIKKLMLKIQKKISEVIE